MFKQDQKDIFEISKHGFQEYYKTRDSFFHAPIQSQPPPPNIPPPHRCFLKKKKIIIICLVTDKTTIPGSKLKREMRYY